MRAKLTTALIVLVATSVVAAVADAEEALPTREQWVAQVEPICKSNTDRNKPLLKSAKQLGHDKKYKASAAKVDKAVANFARTLKALEAVPGDPADTPKLEKWFKQLTIVKKYLQAVAKALREENRVKATHEEIRVERSSNAANNVIFSVFSGRGPCLLKTH